MIKRILACLLLLACWSAAAHGCAENDPYVHTASFAIPSAWGSRTAQLPLDDRWFMQDASVYHHGLARISLAMAVSAFRGSAGRADAPIRHFFDQLNFNGAQEADHQGLPCVQTWDYAAAGEDTIGTAMAWKYINCFESPVPVIAIAVCGGNYGDEWANNLNIGLRGNHEGFEIAAQKMIDRLRQFEQDNLLADANCLYWLAGFGRGGAICDVVASSLSASSTVVCYTFAAPFTTVGPAKTQHGGAFNIVAASDPMTMLPPQEWGFTRHGRTLYLPSSLDANHDYAPLLRQFNAVYSQFTGATDPAGDRDLAPMARAAAKEIASPFQNRANYQHAWQGILLKVFTGRHLGIGDMLRASSLLSDVTKAVQSVQRYALPPVPDGLSLGAFASRELSTLYAQHDPALYAAWMLALPEGNVLLTNSLTLTDAP